MPAPTRVSFATPAVGYGSTATPKVTPTFDVQAGDLLVVVGSSEDNTNVLSTPTSTATVTWTLRQSVVVSSYCSMYIWTGAVTATATGRTVTVARSAGTGAYSFGVSVWRNHGGVGVSAKTNVASGAPSLALTTAANSAIVVGSDDWSAVDGGTTRVWRNVNGAPITESLYFRDAQRYTVYSGYVLDTGAAGAQTLGLSAPAAQKYSIAAVEVLGTAGGSSTYQGTSTTAAATATPSPSAALRALASASTAALSAVTAAATSVLLAATTTAAASTVSMDATRVPRVHPATVAFDASTATASSATVLVGAVVYPATVTFAGSSTSSATAARALLSAASSTATASGSAATATAVLRATTATAAVSGTSSVASVVGGPVTYPVTVTFPAAAGSSATPSLRASAATVTVVQSGTSSATSLRAGASVTFAAIVSVAADATVTAAPVLHPTSVTFEAVSGTSFTASLLGAGDGAPVARGTLTLAQPAARLTLTIPDAGLALDGAGHLHMTVPTTRLEMT